MAFGKATLTISN